MNQQIRHPRSRCQPLCLLLLVSAVALPEAFAADVFNGREIYQTYCEDCHGRTGQGEMPGTPNFKRGQGLVQPDINLLNLINDGRHAMPAFRGILDNEEILDVITYLRTFY